MSIVANDLSLVEKSGEITKSEARMYSAQREVNGISDWDMHDIGIFLDEIFRRIIDKNIETNKYYRVVGTDTWEEKLAEMQGLGYEIYNKRNSFDKGSITEEDLLTYMNIKNLRKEFYTFIFDHIEELNLL